MFYTLAGKILRKEENFCVIEVHGIGFKVLSPAQAMRQLPPEGGETRLFCHMRLKEEGIELYGFRMEGELKLFEMLISVSGVGPKTALLVLDLDSFPNIMAAIIGKRADLLCRAPGIGKKTAERIILELQNKINASDINGSGDAIEVNSEVEDILLGLGYDRRVARGVLREIGEGCATVEEKLREALKILGKRA